MRRRTLLAVLGSGTVSLAGCTTDEQTALPEGCPTSQGLDVRWPRDLDAATVEAFVEEYEHAYYRDVVVEYDPESRLDSYELSGSITEQQSVGDGWELEYSGGGGLYRPTLALEASRTDPPADADVIPVSDIDDERVTKLLEEAADSGEASHHVAPPGEQVDRYVERFASLSDGFDPLSGPGDSDTLYVDVDGTTVELTVAATSFHGDYSWNAWYYVDEQVVRRTTDENTDPRDGTLLECRTVD